MNHNFLVNNFEFNHIKNNLKESEKLFENYLEKSSISTSPSLSTISNLSSDSVIVESKENKKIILNQEGTKQKSLYKTELCRNWEETNHCRYGTKCQYAHGISDLRNVDRHPKYKTQKCRTFHQTGSCPYGSRCTFRHFNLPGDDIRMKEDPIIRFPQLYNSNPWSNPMDEDSLLPSNAESLLPHQLLYDLEAPEVSQRRCPLRNYVHLPTFTQPPHYLPQSNTNCKPFFHPLLF